MPKSNRPLVNDRAMSFRMPSALRAKIAKLAEADHRTVGNYIVKVMSEHVAATAAASKKGGK